MGGEGLSGGGWLGSGIDWRRGELRAGGEGW